MNISISGPPLWPLHPLTLASPAIRLQEVEGKGGKPPDFLPTGVQFLQLKQLFHYEHCSLTLVGIADSPAIWQIYHSLHLHLISDDLEGAVTIYLFLGYDMPIPNFYLKRCTKQLARIKTGS